MLSDSNKQCIIQFFKLLNPNISVSFDFLRPPWDNTRIRIQIEWYIAGIKHATMRETHVTWCQHDSHLLKCICNDLAREYSTTLHKHIDWE